MANFYMTLSAEEISQQIAVLLNTHNYLKTQHNIHTIMGKKGAYFVDVVAGQVVGCSAIFRESDQITRQFHLCVHPDFRRRGIARKLKAASLRNVSTPYVYVTIREDNIPSINLNTSFGFVFVKKEWSNDHYVLTLGRMMNDFRPAASGVVDKIQQSYSTSKPLFYTKAQFNK